MTAIPKIRARLKPDPFRDAHLAEAQDDVAKLVASLAAAGIEASPDDVYEAWRRHSDEYAASWLSLYGNDQADREALLRHFDLES